MARRSYYILSTITACFLLAQMVLVLFAPDATRPAFYYLIGAAIVQLSAYIAVLLHDTILVTRHQRMELPRPIERDLTYIAHEKNVKPEALDDEGKPLRRRASDLRRAIAHLEADNDTAVDLNDIGEQP